MQNWIQWENYVIFLCLPRIILRVVRGGRGGKNGFEYSHGKHGTIVHRVLNVFHSWIINTVELQLIWISIYILHLCLLLYCITEARAEIIGPTVRYLTPDSTLRLICRVVQSTETSEFLFWYQDDRMINYDSDRGVNISTESGKLVALWFSIVLPM